MEVKGERGKGPTDLEAVVELLKDVVAFSLVHIGIYLYGDPRTQGGYGRTTLFTMRWRRIACLSLWGFSIGSGRVGKEVEIKPRSGEYDQLCGLSLGGRAGS